MSTDHDGTRQIAICLALLERTSVDDDGTASHLGFEFGCGQATEASPRHQENLVNCTTMHHQRLRHFDFHSKRSKSRTVGGNDINYCARRHGRRTPPMLDDLIVWARQRSD
jgi:hypothetical protein